MVVTALSVPDVVTLLEKIKELNLDGQEVLSKYSVDDIAVSVVIIQMCFGVCHMCVAGALRQEIGEVSFPAEVFFAFDIFHRIIQNFFYIGIPTKDSRF